MNKTFTVTRTVTEDAIDNNNHMHDAYYNIIFSEVINSMRFMVYHYQRETVYNIQFLLLKHTLLFYMN